LTPAPGKQKSSTLARSGFFPFPRFFKTSILQMSSTSALKNFSRHPAMLPVESTAVLRLDRLRPIAKPAGCRQAMALRLFPSRRCITAMAEPDAPGPV